MPIETPAAPKPSIETLHAMLPALVASAGLRRAAPNFAASVLASPQNLTSPGLSYPVYTLGLREVVSGAGLRAAKLSAWRHEFTSGDEVVAAEISAGRRPQFAGLNVNSGFRSVQHELRSATEASRGLRRPFLRVPAPADFGARRPRAVAEVEIAVPRRCRHPACADARAN